MEPVIQIRNLEHAFGTGELRRRVLNGVSTEIHPGEIILLTGPSGAGKTTILTLVGGLRRVQQGSVRVFGTELAGASQATLLGVRRRIGFIFQNPNLLDSLTVAQNVSLTLSWNGPVPAARARAKALEQLELVGLSDHVDKLPAQLSGGQRQRVAIARALVVEPQLILADEPTSALDRQTGREVVELLRRLAGERHCGILLVTHDSRILDIADRTLSLEDGQLVSRTRDAVRTVDQLSQGMAQLGRPSVLAREIASLGETGFFSFLGESVDELSRVRRALDAATAQVSNARFDQLLVATTIKAGQLLDADRVTLFVVDRAAGKLRSRVAQSGTDSLLSIEIPLGAGIAGQVATTGVPLRLRDAYESPVFNREIDRRTGYRTRSVLCMPVSNARGDVIAVAQVLNKRGADAFDAADEETFQRFLQPLGQLLESVLAMENPGVANAGRSAAVPGETTPGNGAAGSP